MKRFAMIVLAAATMLGGIGVAIAQGHAHGGASFSGGSHVGGSWNGGGSWRGGGNWHGHGGHSRFVVGIGFGAPWWGWWPGYYYPYSYYYPAYYAAYPYYYDYPYPYDYSGGYVEQGSSGNTPQSAPAPGQYSYYCPDPAGYYPQVATCSKGWLRVVPQNAPGPSGPAPQ
jgi:hypothetical protein